MYSVRPPQCSHLWGHIAQEERVIHVLLAKRMVRGSRQMSAIETRLTVICIRRAEVRVDLKQQKNIQISLR